MKLRHFFTRLNEGGNLEVDGAQAQQIDLKVHNRAYIVPILSALLDAINAGYQQNVGGPLWNPKVLKARKYLSGSSLHFFDTNLSDEEFERVKPKVGDIDTQVNKESEPQLAQWLDSVKGQVVGNAKFLGYSRGNEQYSSLWELTDPPIKFQIDFEFVDYSEKDQPTDWAAFSHSSSWDDISQGIKGVFHKWLIQSLTKIASEDFILRKVHKRTGKITDKVERDSMLSFAVSSKEGGGLRTKYEPVLDEKGRPLEIDGLPVLKELPPGNYEKDISKIFQAIFDKRIDRSTLSKALSKTWSFTGLLELINLVLPQEEKESVLDSFVDKLFARGAQGLYKGDPQRDLVEKNVALNYALKTLEVTPPTNLEQMRQEYVKNYRVATEGPVGLDNPIEEAEGDAAPVKAQLRKGMPHLHDLKPLDFLDLLDELHDGNGSFKLQNIPLNVKVDGFGGRFGKNSEGKPFMGTSRTEPRYQAGFVAYHQQKGTTDTEVLGRAQLFDDLFEEMMKAVKLVDSKLGPKFLVNKQVTCEVLFLPFATETPEGKLKFVGIHYDKLPEGVQLALVPFRVVDADTGEDLPDSNEFIKQLLSVGRASSVMFIDNSLTQKEGLDVTALVPPLENLEQFKAMLADKSPGSLQRKRDVAAALDPVKVALEQAIIKDPNILGKDLLGKDYEGIVINSRLGPIKVTSQEQRDVISAKQDAKKTAWTERPRENANKTAVVAVGSFIGHKGHEELFNYTINKAKEVGGDPYLFIGNAEGKDDPIPTAVKVQTWHKLYPQYANNISTVQAGGQLIQKIKHELINPLPGKPPRYDNIIIMVGEDRAGMNMPAALMKAVNKFPGYEHVKVSLDVTPRGTGISGTALRNSLKNDPPEKALSTWSNAFDVNKLGVDWVKHLMDITRKGMGIQQPQPEQPAPQPVAESRLFNSLIRPATKQGVAESPIEMDPAEPMNPTIYGHQGVNSAELKTRMMRAKGQLADLAQRAQNASPLEWEMITRNFKELSMNIEQIRHALEELAKVRKLGGIRSRGIDKNIGEQGVAEAGSAAQQAAIAIAKEKSGKYSKKDGHRLKEADDNSKCPPATQDIALNLKNRQKAINEYGYGPLNPDLPNNTFWMKKVDEWNLDSIDEAKQSLCGNCAAFDQRADTLDCIAQGIGSTQGSEDPTIEAGDLGYCRFLKFKCASRRTCDAWVTGGPLVDKKDVAESTRTATKCVPVNEDVQDIMDSLINKIIMNEAILHNKR